MVTLVVPNRLPSNARTVKVISGALTSLTILTFVVFKTRKTRLMPLTVLLSALKYPFSFPPLIE